MNVLVVLPTYNEAENIDRVLRRIRKALARATVLVVDDGSPDGTADIAETIGKELGNIEVMRRHAKSGLGSAYRAGFRWGLDHGFDVCVEMDADLSHEPEALPGLVAPLAEEHEPGHRVEVRDRAAPSPTGPGTAACCPGAATSTPPRCSVSGWPIRPQGSAAYSASVLEPHRPRPDPGRGLRVPDRDDLPGQAGRGLGASRSRSGSSTGWTASRRCPCSSSSRPGPGDLVGGAAVGGAHCGASQPVAHLTCPCGPAGSGLRRSLAVRLGCTGLRSDRGTGPPVVLLHGQPGSGAVVGSGHRRLVEREFRVLAPDRIGLRGHRRRGRRAGRQRRTGGRAHPRPCTSARPPWWPTAGPGAWPCCWPTATRSW